jgi:hypothetical protein
VPGRRGGKLVGNGVLLRPGMEPVEGPEMKFYRYSAQRYTDSLLKSGEIRIGTLHDFRRSEHKRGVADPMEGRKIISHHIDSVTPGGNTIHDKALRFFGGIEVVNSTGCTVQNFTYQTSVETEDCFILCGSTEHSQTVANEFDEADSCVQIIDVRKFTRVLTSKLGSIFPIATGNVCIVEYVDKAQNWNGKDLGLNPAVLKEPEFSGQKEFRIIWPLREKIPISPVIVRDKRIRRLLRNVGIPS